MPCIWLHHNKSQIFIDVAIIDANRLDDLFDDRAPKKPVRPDVHLFKALLDTGAQTTMVSKTVADRVGLKPLGKIPVVGVGGLSLHYNYLFHVAFVLIEETPDGKEPIKSIYTLNNPIEGGEINLENAGFDVLLGMDVIATDSLAVEGGGTFSFSF